MIVQPEPDSRLEQLCAQYDRDKDAANTAVEKLKTTVDAIKLETTKAAPGSTDTQLRSRYLDKPLRLYARRSWKFDIKRFRKDDPDTCVRYEYQTTEWRLEQVK